MQEQQYAFMSGIGRRTWKWSGVGFIVAFLLWVGLEWADVDREPGTWLIRKLFHPGPKYYEFSIDLMVEGQPLTLSRVIECKPYYHSPQLQFYKPAWYPARQAMTHRLESGAGIIVVFPRVCSQNLRYRPLPGDFIPVILWADNAANPTEIEAYYSGDIVRSGTARVQFLAFRLGEGTPSARVDNSAEFGHWDDDEYAGTGHRPRPKTFFATYALVVSREQWVAVPAVASSLQGMTEAAFLESAPLQAALRTFPPVQDNQARGMFDDYRVRTGRLDLFAEIMPFRRVNNVFQPSPSERGVVVYYPIRELFGDQYFTEADSRSLSVAYSISGTSAEATLRNLPRSLFDPGSQQLYETTDGYFRFIPNSSIQGDSK